MTQKAVLQIPEKKKSSVKELSELLEINGCKIIKAGTRRNLWFMIAMPFKMIKCWVTGKKLQGNIFWDILGFAEFVWSRKL